MSISNLSLFISFEGIDNCGKSTQIKLLVDKLNKEKIKTILVREPGGTDISEKIRTILLDKTLNNMESKTEALLMIASRAQLTKEIIIPKLQEGFIVLADRYKDSTIAYQGSRKGLNIDLLEKMNNFATFGLDPDITFLFDISSKVGVERRGNQNLDRIEKAGEKFQELVRNQYLKLALKKKDRFVVLDGNLSIQSIQAIIWKNIRNKIKNKNFE